MGFQARLAVVCEQTKSADSIGPKGEKDCTVWKEACVGIDFEHITRLEKLVGERFKHMADSHTPFRRAGIVAMDCFLTRIFADFVEKLDEKVAPEFLIHKPIFPGDERVPTVTVGGQVYLDCPEYRLKGSMGNETLVEDHNRAAGNPEALRILLERGEWHPMMDPPLLWARCRELADLMHGAQCEQTEGWQSLVKDRTSLAIWNGWYHQLLEMGEVGARAVFRFS